MAGAHKGASKIKELGERALGLERAKRFTEALALYARLCELAPEDPEWARRAADCCWHIKDAERRLEYALRAARAYAASGLTQKAIAMTRVALSLDATNRVAQKELARLRASQTNSESPSPPLGARSVGSRPRDAAQAVRIAHAALKAHTMQTGPTSADATASEGRSRPERLRARMDAADALRRARTRRLPDGSRARPRAVGPPSSQNPLQASVPTRPAHLEPADPSPSGAAKASVPDETKPPTPAALELSSPPGPPLLDLQLRQRVASLPVRAGTEVGGIHSLPLSLVPPAAPSGDIPPIRYRRSEEPAALDPTPRWESFPPEASEMEAGPDSVEWALRQRRSDQTKLGQTPLFSQLDPQLLDYLIDIVDVIELSTHQVLVREGAIADAMYVVVAGSVVAMTALQGDRPIELARIEEGEFFGEIGLLSDQPHQATVSAAEPTRLLRLDRSTVGFIVDQAPEFLTILLKFLKDRLLESLMVTSPLFAPFSEAERVTLCERFDFFEIDSNSLLLNRGQHPIGMYVLLSGNAVMTTDPDVPGAARRLCPGDIFGEQALLNNEPSTIQVRATSKCFALCLPSDAFAELIVAHPIVLEYLAGLRARDVLHVGPDFLDHISFF